jgi:hypothetical protein
VLAGIDNGTLTVMDEAISNAPEHWRKGLAALTATDPA